MLFDKKTIVNKKPPLLELINKRRRQILVHSYIYYKTDNNLIPDYLYDKWCKELVKLHNENPELARKADFDEVFINWSGFSGYDLFKDNSFVEVWARYKAYQLTEYALKNNK